MSQPIPLSERIRRVGSSPIRYLMEQAVSNPGLISLAAGLVDRESLPWESIRDAALRATSDERRGKVTAQYGDPAGPLALRKLLAEQVHRLDRNASTAYRESRVLPDSGGPIDPARVVMTTGSQQLLYLVGEACLDPGDVVLVSTPGYYVFMATAQSMGARVLPVPTDESGLVVEELERILGELDNAGQLDRVKLVYDVTYFNNPTGLSLTWARKRRLLDVAERWSRGHRILLLEDAAYRELRYRGEEIPSLLAFDRLGEHTIYAGTFSKPFAPGLKVGYGILPPDLVDAILLLKGHHDFGSAHVTQQVALEVLASGDYERQLQKLKAVYQEKLRATLEILNQRLAGTGVAWTKPHGGFYVWLTFPDGVSTSTDSDLYRLAIERGVLYLPGEHCYPAGADRPTNALRVSVGLLPLDRLAEGVERLASAILEVLASRVESR